MSLPLLSQADRARARIEDPHGILAQIDDWEQTHQVLAEADDLTWLKERLS
jgi:hypothetical protein